LVICYIPSDIVKQRDPDEDLDSPTYRVENYFRAVDISLIHWARTFAEYETAPAITVEAALLHLKNIYSRFSQMPAAMKTRVTIGIDMGFILEPEPPTPEVDLSHQPNTDAVDDQTSHQPSSAVLGALASSSANPTPGRTTHSQRARTKATNLKYDPPTFQSRKRGKGKEAAGSQRKRVRISAPPTLSDADDEGNPTDTDAVEVIDQQPLPKTKTSMRSKRGGLEHHIIRRVTRPIQSAAALSQYPGDSAEHALLAASEDEATARRSARLTSSSPAAQTLSRADIKSCVDETVREAVRREVGELHRDVEGLRNTVADFIQSCRNEQSGVREQAELYKRTVDESSEAVRRVTDAVTAMTERIFARFPPMAEDDIPALNLQQLRRVMGEFSNLFEGFLHISSTRDNALRFHQQPLTPVHVGHHSSSFLPYSSELPQHRGGAPVAPTSQLTSASPGPAAIRQQDTETTAVPRAPSREVTVPAEMFAALQQLLKDQAAHADSSGTPITTCRLQSYIVHT
jgi:hypothetical protein